MSTISTILSTLRSAVWAIDVRDEIANAIEQCYKDVNSPSLVTDGIEEVIGDMVDNGRISGAIVEDLGLITEGTSNLFDFTTVTAGRLNTGTGAVDTATGYWVSDYIPVEAGVTYYFTGTDRRVAYNSSKAYSANISSATSWTASADGYIRISVTTANRKTAKVNAGSNKPYRPGRSPIDFNLRDDVYRKAEVDAALAAVTIATDPELETAGAAADAKATGDAISALNESLGNIDLSNLSSGLKEAIMQLGLHDALVEESYLYTYDYTDESYSRFSNATSDILSVSQGTLGIKGGGAGSTLKTAVFFDENVNEIEYAFESNNNYYCYPLLSSAWIERNTDTVKSIKYLPLNKDGWNGLWKTFTNDWHTQGMQATNKWVAETPISKVRIRKNTETFTLTFTHTDDTTTVKTITLADIGATGHFPERLGLLVGKAVTNAGTSFATNVKISSSAIFLTSVSAADSPLYGVTWDAWGDSITAGSESYHSYVATNTGCTVNNYGVSGDKMASVLSRYNTNTAASGEYITVFAGVNDYLYATSAASFRSTVQSLLSAIVAKAPFMKCGFITPMQKLSQDANSEGLTLEDYVDIILEECAAKSMPVLDLFHEGNWYGFNTAFSNAYTSDGLHPNASGHAYLGRKIQKWLESM